MKAVIALGLIAMLGACATGNQPPVQNDRAQLAEKCQARGGHLVPIAGANNANEAANYYCDLPGGGQAH